MRKIITAAEPFERFERSTAEGRALCADLKQEYKVEHIDDDLKKYPVLSFYRQGEFIDLCRGPHIPNAGKVGAFKLLSIAGAYWKNDSTRKQLQRLYATAFFNEKDLKAYLEQLEEAKRRDHRVLGKQLRLFTISQQAGQGLILWMPKGAMVRSILENFIKDELLKRGYSPVYTPHIGNLNLYRTSGHFPYYADAQYPPLFMNPLSQTVDTWYTLLEKGHLSPEREQAFLNMIEEITKGNHPAGEEDYPRYPWSQIALDLRTLWLSYRKAPNLEAKREELKNWLVGQEGYLLKPMNCPHHIQIYKAMPHSYRDLPIRLAEFGTVYRFEQSGELGGLTRVRGFTQDDAHLFVTPEQVEATMPSGGFRLFLQTLGLNDYRVRVSVRDPDSGKYVGPPELWANAEKTLIDVAKKLRPVSIPASANTFTSRRSTVASRLYRPGVAARHGAARLQPAEALRPRLHRRRQRQASASHDPPRAVRLDGAVLRHPDRAFRRRLPALARAGAGPHPDRVGKVHRLRQEGRRRNALNGIPRRRRLPSGKNRRQDSRRIS